MDQNSSRRQVKILLLLLTTLVVCAQDTNVVISPPVTERMTNAPLVVATFPDPDPCPICKGLSHHEFQLVRYSAFDTIKQTTEFKGQKKSHVIFVGPTTNWITTNVVAKGTPARQQPGYSSPPPLPK